jgi:ribosomal 50S subunit-recycling heat shock protein
VVQPIAVQLIMIQQSMPDVTLRLGQSLLARVAERHGDRGILMLAGQPLVAQLPKHVRAGDVLKLAVRDITAEQVVMQLHEGKESAEAAQQGQEAPAAIPIPFPGGPPASIYVDDQAGGGEGAGEGDVSAIALTYDSPALGPINLRIGMDATAVAAEVRVAAGAPLELAAAAASALRDALAAGTERVASVTVAPRPGSFDVSA